MSNTNITSYEIAYALEQRYIMPEWVIGFEVPNGTGALRRRRADAVAVNLYPSKNFEVRGFEIKISKSDLKKDLEFGGKSNEVAKYCDYWFLVTPPNLTDGADLPASWGVIEFDGKTLRQKRAAARIENKIPANAVFMTAILQARERLLSMRYHQELAEAVEKDLRAQILANDRKWERAIADMRNRATATEKVFEQLKNDTGIDLRKQYFCSSDIEKIKTAVKYDSADDIKQRAKRTLSDLKFAVQALEKVCD